MNAAMPGPEITREEWRACLEEVFQGDTNPGFLVASGSLPPGVPRDFFGRMARRCREQNIKLILDTSGDPLKQAAEEGGIFLIKPNMRELRTLAGREMEDGSELCRGKDVENLYQKISQE